MARRHVTSVAVAAPIGVIRRSGSWFFTAPVGETRRAHTWRHGLAAVLLGLASLVAVAQHDRYSDYRLAVDVPGGEPFNGCSTSGETKPQKSELMRVNRKSVTDARQEHAESESTQ